MAFSLDALIRLIHVLGAAFWFGGGLFFIAVIYPAVQAAGPNGGAVMQAITRRGGLGGRWFGPVSTITVVAGLYLYIKGDYHVGPFDDAVAALLTVGVAFGILAFLVGLGMALPNEKRMKALVAEMPEGAPPTPEQAGQMQQLAATAMKAGKAGTALAGAAFILMAGRWIFA